jgi:hypothetical protein
MERGQPTRYVLEEDWKVEDKVWPRGETVYLMPLSVQPQETLVDIYRTDNAEDAVPTSGAPRCRILSTDLVVDGETVRMRTPTDLAGQQGLPG